MGDIFFESNNLRALAGILPLPGEMSHLGLANRFLLPLEHPWTAVGGSVASVGLFHDEQLRLVGRLAWRLLRLLLAL